MGGHTNIVFSNGALDPWSNAGVMPAANSSRTRDAGLDPSLVPVLLDLGGHHLDLFFPTAQDPPCAKQARAIEEANIRKWVGARKARFD